MNALMRRLADLPIRSRIAIVCLIPLLAFTGFAGKQMLEKHTQWQAADSVSALIDVNPFISGLIHELQKERASSVGFVSSKGQAQGDTMRAQRAVVDKALASWRARMAGSIVPLWGTNSAAASIRPRAIWGCSRARAPASTRWR